MTNVWPSNNKRFNTALSPIDAMAPKTSWENVSNSAETIGTPGWPCANASFPRVVIPLAINALMPRSDIIISSALFLRWASESTREVILVTTLEAKKTWATGRYESFTTDITGTSDFHDSRTWLRRITPANTSINLTAVEKTTSHITKKTCKQQSHKCVMTRHQICNFSFTYLCQTWWPTDLNKHRRTSLHLFTFTLMVRVQLLNIAHFELANFWLSQPLAVFDLWNKFGTSPSNLWALQLNWILCLLFYHTW